MNTENKFSLMWKAVESPDTLPRRVGTIHEIDFDELEHKINEQHSSFVKSIVESLYGGDAYLLKNVFSKQFMLDVKDGVHHYWSTRPPSFHKMLEGCPDFHRIIDEETAKNYTFKAVKHSCYFFPWNDDPLDLFPTVRKRWRPLKFLGGLRFDEFEGNTPKDGIVDRIQIIRYPPKIGLIETHSDPYKIQRIITFAYMSKQGVDYHGGGFYFLDGNNEKVFVEARINIGDMCVAYPTVLHGMLPVDVDKTPDMSAKDGRWVLGPFSNSSDEVQDRHVGYAVKVEAQYA